MVAVSLTPGTSVPTTLLTGLLIAFALQILAAGLYGVIAVTWLYRQRAQTDSAQGANQIHGLKHGIGSVLLLTANSIVGLACYFAVKLSFASSSIAGAILGLVIWSAYLVIWVWFIGKGVGLLLGKSVRILSAGLTSLLAWMTGRQTPASLESLQTQMAAQQSRLMDLQQQLDPARIRQTVEQAVAAGHEDSPQPHPVWQQVEHYVSDPSQKLTTRAIRQHLETLMQPLDQNPGSLPPFDRQAVQHCLAARPDLSPKRQTRIADRLETAWNEVTQQMASNSDSTTTAEPALDEAQNDLSEAGWLGLVVLLVQTSLKTLEAEDWAEARLHQKSSQVSAWLKTGRQKLQQQIDQLRQQTRDQVRTTQQTLITLIWWVLATAVTSGLTAAMAGTLAVR